MHPWLEGVKPTILKRGILASGWYPACIPGEVIERASVPRRRRWWVKRLLPLLMLAWWLFYWDGEHWIQFGSWNSESLCEANAQIFLDKGISAVCIEVKSW